MLYNQSKYKIVEENNVLSDASKPYYHLTDGEHQDYLFIPGEGGFSGVDNKDQQFFAGGFGMLVQFDPKLSEGNSEEALFKIIIQTILKYVRSVAE